MRHPFRQQLLRPLLTVMTTAVIVVAGLSAWVSSARQVEVLRSRQTAVARVLEDATFPLTSQVLRRMADLSEQEFIVWSPERQQSLATSWSQPPSDLDENLRGMTDRSGHVPSESLVILEGNAFAVGLVHSRTRPTDEILILTHRRSLLDVRMSAIWPPLALGCVTLAVLIPLVLGLTNRWSARVEAIQQSVAEIARGNLTATLMPSTVDDELAALIGDIEQMRSQLGTLHSERLRTERERLVAQMAAGFAHQFRNGIAGASLALQLHGRRCEQTSDSSLSVAKRQLALLEAEVRGILALARPPESPRSHFDLHVVTRNAAELVAPNLSHQGISLDMSLASHPAIIHGHADALRSAILNLLLNGIDAAGPGGRLRLESTCTDRSVTIAVRDSGPGPAPHVEQRLTEAFVTTKPEGVGLGLTIVAAAAHDHGGHFRWYREDTWTVMELTLPRPLGIVESAE